MLRNTIILFILCTLAAPGIQTVSAQADDYPYREYAYNYIHYDKNTIQFPGETYQFDSLWLKFDKLIKRGEGKINIVHFGGSHIQAGIYSGQARKQFQSFYSGLNGGRGLVFPYIVGRSRGPRNYSFRVTGNWTACKNVGRNACYPGVLGIQAETRDTTATLSFTSNPDYLDYDFNRIKVFHDFHDRSFQIAFPDSFGEYTVKEFPELDYTEIRFRKYFKRLKMQFEKTDEKQDRFTLYGISFETDDPGIVYHDSGINGASLPSYNRCVRFERQLEALRPDLVIISLGTNDTYTRNFKPDYYKQNYTELLRKIEQAAPQAAVIMTVPNDSYYRRRYPNTNTQKAEAVILETAESYNCGVWDFYEIMGGLNSSYLWHKDGLMAYDRIHFTPSGYLIKGNLFFWAVLKAYDEHISSIAPVYDINTQ